MNPRPYFNLFLLLVLLHGVPASATGVMRDLHCLPDSYCMAVGDDGLIRGGEASATRWQTFQSGSDRVLRAVHCLDRQRCRVGGDQGLLMGSDDGGASWEIFTSGSTASITALHCATGGRCLAVGSGGTILISNDAGRRWQLQEHTSPASLSDVDCLPSGRCVVVGIQGQVLLSVDHGASWQPLIAPGAPDLGEVDCVADGYCLVIGLNWLASLDPGTQSWSVVDFASWPVPDSPDLHTLFPGSLACASRDTCTALFDAGVYYFGSPARPPGLSMQSNLLGWEDWRGTNEPPGAVDCLDAQHCLAVGAQQHWHSSDGGLSWNPLAVAFEPPMLVPYLTPTSLFLVPPTGPLPGDQTVALGFMVNSPLGPPEGTVELRLGDALCSAPAAQGHCMMWVAADTPPGLTATLIPGPGFAASSANLAVQIAGAESGNPGIPVTTTAMVVDADCASLTASDLAAGDGLTSLPEALCLANNRPGADTLILAVDSLYLLESVDNHWFGPNGLPPISSEITIQGQGSTLRRADTAPPFRFFYIAGHPQMTLPRGTLTLEHLSLENGLARAGDAAPSGGGGGGLGGAIFNHGRLVLRDSLLRANQALGGAGGIDHYGDAPHGAGGGMGSPGVGNQGGGFGGAFDNAALASRGWLAGGGGSGFGPRQAGGEGYTSDWSAWPDRYALIGIPGEGAGGGGSGGESFVIYDWTLLDGHGGGTGQGGLFAGGGGVGGGGGGLHTDLSDIHTSGSGGFGGGGGIARPGGFAGGAGAYHAESNNWGNGGAALGGAIFNHLGSVLLQRTGLVDNQATGGPGGNALAGGDYHSGFGGDAGGGGLFSLSGEVVLLASEIRDNRAEPGVTLKNFSAPDSLFPEHQGHDCNLQDSQFHADAGSVIGDDDGDGCPTDSRWETIIEIVDVIPSVAFPGTAVEVVFRTASPIGPTSGQVEVLSSEADIFCEATVAQGSCMLVFAQSGEYSVQAQLLEAGSFHASISAPQTLPVMPYPSPDPLELIYQSGYSDLDPGLMAIDCPTPEHCVAVGGTGFSAIAVVGNGTDWNWRWVASIGSANLARLDCPSEDFCIASGTNTSRQGILARSQDGGLNWELLPDSPGLAGDYYGDRRTALISCPDERNCLVAESADYLDTARLVWLRDAGDRWEEAGGSDSLFGPIEELHCLDTQRCLLIGRGNFSQRKLWLSVDGAQSWIDTGIDRDRLSDNTIYSLQSPLLESADIAAWIWKSLLWGNTRCPDPLVCVRGGWSYSWFNVTSNAGQRWWGFDLGIEEQVNSLLSCISVDTCLVTGTAVIYRLHPVAATRIEVIGQAPDPAQPGEPVRIDFQVHSDSDTQPIGRVSITVAEQRCQASVRQGYCELTIDAAGGYPLEALFSSDAGFAPARDASQVLRVGPQDATWIFDDGFED